MATPETCFRCGTRCVACSCAPCPKCDFMLCATCDVASDATSLRRDMPLPSHGGPRRCSESKPLERVVVRYENEEFRRDYNSYELLPVGDAAVAVSSAILSCLWAVGDANP
jgi:hypothetical protein